MRRIEKKKTLRRGFTIYEVLLVVSIIFLLITLIIPMIQYSRETARRSACQNNLKRIGLALSTYENRFGFFPPAVQDSREKLGECKQKWETAGGFSWRTLILPDLNRQALHNQIDFSNTNRRMRCVGAENSPMRKANISNIEVLKAHVDEFYCVADNTPHDLVKENSQFGANYVAMISSRTHYDYSNDEAHPDRTTDKHIGVLHSQKPAQMADIKADGLSSTIMVVEVDRSLAVQKLSDKTAMVRCGQWHSMRGCLADAHRAPDDFGTAASPKIDQADNPTNWCNILATTNENPTNGLAASSAHGLGAYVCTADGAIHFVTMDIDISLYRNTCTRSGKESATIEF